jgi:hypothetical protein
MPPVSAVRILRINLDNEVVAAGRDAFRPTRSCRARPVRNISDRYGLGRVRHGACMAITVESLLFEVLRKGAQAALRLPCQHLAFLNARLLDLKELFPLASVVCPYRTGGAG